jgi:hypothetical protein
VAGLVRFGAWRGAGPALFVGVEAGALVAPALANAQVAVLASGQVGVVFR